MFKSIVFVAIMLFTNNSVSDQPGAILNIICDNNRLIGIEVIANRPGTFRSPLSDADCSRKHV